MIESNNPSESNEKSEYYENKIQRLSNELEIQNQKRNEEMEELFKEMESENIALKKDLMQIKQDLEEEKDKTNNIKNSIYNFNYFQTDIINNLNEKQKITPLNKKISSTNTNTIKYIDENYYNSPSLYCDNLKLIKEENAKKLEELNLENDSTLKNFDKNWNIFEKNVKNLLDMNKSKNNSFFDENKYNIQYNDIMKK